MRGYLKHPESNESADMDDDFNLHLSKSMSNLSMKSKNKGKDETIISSIKIRGYYFGRQIYEERECHK